MAKIRLLMIDDDEMFLRMYDSVLSRHYQVATALTLKEGLKQMDTFKPDILLLDIRLNSEKEGLQALPDIKARYPELPIIIVTNWDSHLIFREALELGADDFFIKSEDLDILKTAIENLLAQRQVENHAFRNGYDTLLVFDPLSKKKLKEAQKLARANCFILITGESGVGKEEFARYIHRHSSRKNGPFVAINCAAIPDTLFESEFFGHEAGAFTDARFRRIGKFEAANGGTLFLDEVEELSLAAQAKLLRITQDLVVERLGSNKPIPIDVRIISATRNNLEKLVETNQFREDLYYRLAVYPFEVPPLRERPEDILPLCHQFLKESCQRNGISRKAFSKDALLVLKSYHWPGNVRELKNAIEQAVVASDGHLIHASDFMLKRKLEGEELEPYDEARRRFMVQYIRKALVQHDGNITRAARAIGLSRQMLQKIIRDFGISVTEK